VCTLSGIAPDASEAKWQMSVDPSAFVEGNQVGRLAAWMEVLELEEDGDASAKKRIKELGLKHKLATSQTSWVCSLDNEKFR
jgi:hypothetical protein